MWRAEWVRYWAELRFYRQLLFGNLLNQLLVMGGDLLDCFAFE